MNIQIESSEIQDQTKQDLEDVLRLWKLGVQKWRMNHDSIPTAFVDLAVCIDCINLKRMLKTQNAMLDASKS